MAANKGDVACSHRPGTRLLLLEACRGAGQRGEGGTGIGDRGGAGRRTRLEGGPWMAAGGEGSVVARGFLG